MIEGVLWGIALGAGLALGLAVAFGIFILLIPLVIYVLAKFDE